MPNGSSRAVRDEARELLNSERFFGQKTHIVPHVSRFWFSVLVEPVAAMGQ